MGINDNHYTSGAKYSRRGSNPRPPAHKTGALPLSYWSRGLCAGWDPGPAGLRGKKKKKEVCIPDGTRTHNLRLRKPTPCPFGHWDNTMPEVGFEPTRTEAQQILSLPPYTSRAFRHARPPLPQPDLIFSTLCA